MLFVALLPAGTPARNLTADPPPATGPYMIAKVGARSRLVLRTQPGLDEDQRRSDP